MRRWITGAVTALAAVSGLAAPGPAWASSGSWRQVYQVNTSGNFSALAAISRNDIWAVGDLIGKKGNIIYRPFIRHYAGGRWKAVTIPGAPRFASDQVSASSASNVWVFGLTSRSAAASVAYRYDGSHWHRIAVPAETYLQGAVALDPRNVWAFGFSNTIRGNAFHWNGASWRGYNLDNGRLLGESISASASNNVWIGWDTEAKSYAMHWDGHRWRTLTVPNDIRANTSNIVMDGKGGYWFGDAAILTGNRWTSEPPIKVTGGFGPVVRIRGTRSFLQGATVRSSRIQKPALYRFDL